METSENNLLNTRALSIGYATTKIAENINFSLQKGTLCGIVGVNGIGKSTLMRTLAGLQQKLSGTVEIQNHPLESLSVRQLAKSLAVVLTEPVASRNLTVKELIALGRQPYTNWLGTLTKDDIALLHDSLVLFELEELKEHKCHQLSDGQLQRVLIARAMVQETSLILLDEPTTHLDLHHKVQILKVLKSLAREQSKGILFTTHEVGMAIQLCDTILILDGKENPFGTPCELIEAGYFERLFPLDAVTFDAKTGTFKINE